MSEGKRDWTIYRGSNQPTPAKERTRWLDELTPPWRAPPAGKVEFVKRPEQIDRDGTWRRRGETYVSAPEGNELEYINVALLLRRPLLVTGEPGLGKSTLAYSIAHCLDLGPPLRWEIGSRTTLEEGLYRYDAVEHLRAARGAGAREEGDVSVGSFITLGPLGTALLPTGLPRTLLIDEIDKASYDLPNDLLHVLEEAAFTIPELLRVGGTQQVYPWDSSGPKDTVPVVDGRVRTHHHPVVVITSNGEREFPPAFLRRCVRLDLKRPGDAHMAKIVDAQFRGRTVEPATLERVLAACRDRTTDVLLQTLFLASHGVTPPEGSLGASPAVTRPGSSPP